MVTLLLFIRNPRNKTNLVQDNEQYHTKVLHRSSHLNGGTQGFSPQISDLILTATLYHVILAPHEIAAAFVRVVRFALDLLAHDWKVNPLQTRTDFLIAALSCLSKAFLSSLPSCVNGTSDLSKITKIRFWKCQYRIFATHFVVVPVLSARPIRCQLKFYLPFNLWEQK